MNAVMKESNADHSLDGMSNDEYHKPSNGLSTSGVKELADDPASLIWRQEAEQNKDKLSAIDFGTDFHLYFLEPDVFKKTHRVLPVFNRRKPAEKKEELDMIADWKREGIVSVKSEDMEKLEAMRQSALSHPTVNAIMSLNGVAERSFFWTDERTGVACKCRPDWLVLNINDSNRLEFMRPDSDILAMDVKTIADISRIQAQIETLKYYVQDPFYTQGIEQVTGGKVEFVFAFVSTSLSLGRYPAQVVRLTDTAVFDGKQVINEALHTYSTMIASDDSVWQTVVDMDRPRWATRDDEYSL